MYDYRVDAATKEEWAERAFAAERKLAELQKKYLEATAEPEPSTWHYQLMKHVEKTGDVWYGVHEIYGKGQGYTLNAEGYTLNTVSVDGESKEDVVWQLKAILNDIDKYDVVDYEEENKE